MLRSFLCAYECVYVCVCVVCVFVCLCVRHALYVHSVLSMQPLMPIHFLSIGMPCGHEIKMLEI